MHAYLTNIAITLRLMSRERTALVFSYLFPLMFFFLFAQMMSAAQGGGVAKQVVTSVLIFGVLGNGFFGAGMRAVSDREQNILRRFKVAPTTAAPLLTGWMVTGWINYLPSALFLICLGHFIYQMPWPERPVTLFVFLTVAVLAFRSLGLIIASVVNSMQESQILIQLCYLPMLFLSGATFPISAMPDWLQIVAQYLPASHLYSGLQGILLRKEGLETLWKSLLALFLTMLVGMFLSVKLFRWEKEQKVKTSAKLWVLAALAPFLVLGTYQAITKESLQQAKVLQREVRRSRTLLIRDARLFLGDGQVIERGAVLIQEGRIARIFTGDAPDAKSLHAEAIEGSGKTVLPGLIDARVHLTLPGGVVETLSEKTYEKELAAYLYSGVTGVISLGDPVAQAAQLRAGIQKGSRLGAEVFVGGAMFTTRAAAAAGRLRFVPAAVRDRVGAEMFRFPDTPAMATEQVGALAGQGQQALWVDSAALPTEVTEAILRAAQAAKLPVFATSEVPGAAVVVGGSNVPATAVWSPALASLEAAVDMRPELLKRTLVQQVAGKGVAAATLARISPATARDHEAVLARQRLVPGAAGRLLAGSGAGEMFLIHGPALHRELFLLVQAGASTLEALQAATGRAAMMMGAGGRIGFLRQGLEANIVVVDGNPLEDISITERISLVIFRGERLNRPGLLEDERE